MREKQNKSEKAYRVFQKVESEEDDCKSSFEKVLRKIEDEGRYQKILIICFMLPLATLNSLGSSDTNLLLTTPSHSCHVPRNSSLNITEEEWKNLTIPWEKNSLGDTVRSSCSMYNISGDNSLDKTEHSGYISSLGVHGCDHGWDFDQSTWEETPITKFGWVCDQKYMTTFMFSLRYTGGAVGTLLFSVISDRLGRKPTFFFVLLLHTSCSVVISLVSSPTAFAICLFLIAVCYYTFYQMAYIIVIELCGPKLRAFTSSASFIACVGGNCLMSFTAYMSSYWGTFIKACHLPSLVFLFYWRILPESPRWLLSRSRIGECEKILIKIARINGREFGEASKDLLMDALQEEKKKSSLKNLMESFVLLKHLALTSFILSIGYIIYSGMILNIHNMTGSEILNFFILSLVEIPGNVLGSVAAQRYGRRLSSIVFMGLSSLCSVASVLVLRDPYALPILCSLNKMFIGALVLIVYMQIGELFPTLMRGTAYGITGIISLAAIIFIPPLIAMGASDAFVLYYILFGFGLFGLLLCTFLPETVDQPLPQTIQEAVLIGKNQPYFSIISKLNSPKNLNDNNFNEVSNKMND